MKYFDHDTDACQDELVQALRLECGGEAVDTYWTILETIYREETDLVLGENQPLTKSVTHWLCTDWETLKTQFFSMREIGLIDVTENSDGTYTLHSDRASENIKSYKLRVETARQNGMKGGRKPKPNRRKTKGKPNTNRTLTQPKTKEKEKVLGNYTLPNTDTASVGADADGSAPPDAKVPCCPLCSGVLRFSPSSLTWECSTCGTVKEPSFKEAVA